MFAGNDTVRYIAYEFLFDFHCNYGHILYRFQDNAKDIIFHNPFYLTRTITQNLFEFIFKILIQTVGIPNLLDDAKNVAEKFNFLQNGAQRH